MDAIAEPITHLVRNAISHGIETAEERTRNGKPAHGTLRLSSYHHGNQVIVEVSDDGRGIDVQKIKAKALQQGMVSSEEAGRLSENEILEFVFRRVVLLPVGRLGRAERFRDPELLESTIRVEFAR